MTSRILPSLNARHLLTLAWIVVLGVLLLLAADAFIGKPGKDSSAYIYIAQGILKGELPYVDRWDNKGPLIYSLNAFALLIHETWGLWVVESFFLLGSAAFAFLTLRKSFGLLPAAFALALFLAFYARFTAPGNNYTEQYGLLFQFLALYLFLRSQDLPNPALSQARFASLHLAIGALGAASFLLRPNLVALWLVIGIYWLVARGYSLRKLAWAVVGGGSILLLVAGFFMATGAWSAFWKAVFVANVFYSDANFQDRLVVLWDLIRRMDLFSLLVIVAWCTALYTLWRKRLRGEASRGLIVVAAILFPLEVVSLSLSGFSFKHYYLTVLPVAAVLLAYLAWFVARERLAAPTFLSAVLLIGVFSFSFSQSQFTALSEKYLEEGLFAEDKHSLVGDRIRLLTQPGDRILVWGFNPRLYLYAGRDASTRFVGQAMLVKPSPISQELRELFLAELREDMPALIVDMRDLSFPPLDSVGRASWRPKHGYIHDPEVHRPFFDFVEAHYARVEIYHNHAIYLPKPKETLERPNELGELIIRSIFNVYRNDRILTFAKDSCSQDAAARRFILHVIPVDNSVIDGKAEANLDFSFQPPDTWRPGEACVVSVELPDYPIAFIRTGQYNASRTGDIWLSEYHLPQSE